MRLQTKEAQEFRLQQICSLREEGFKQSEIADLVGCTQGWVSQILKRAKEVGVENLKAKKSKAGNKPALDEEKLADLSRVLELEARASGFETDGWTRKRVAKVIFERYGVKHHPSHISRILAKLDFTRQKLLGEHYRKDEQATKTWYEESLPALKKKAVNEGYRFVYVDEASVSLCSSLGYTYARRGEPPVVEINTEITKRLYLASGISAKGELIYKIRKKPFDGAAIVALLKQMLKKFSGKLLIVWDNASIHDCEETRRFLTIEERAKRLHLAKQPTYSPEVNADEQVWNQIKTVGLKNTCYENIKELKSKIIKEFEKLKSKPNLIKQFFHHEDVGFYN